VSSPLHRPRPNSGVVPSCAPAYVWLSRQRTHAMRRFGDINNFPLQCCKGGAHEALQFNCFLASRHESCETHLKFQGVAQKIDRSYFGKDRAGPHRMNSPTRRRFLRDGSMRQPWRCCRLSFCRHQAVRQRLPVVGSGVHTYECVHDWLVAARRPGLGGHPRFGAG